MRYPLFPSIVLLTLAWVLLQRPKGRARLTGLLIAGALWLFTWLPFAWLTSGTLEWAYPQQMPDTAGAQAIVVLSGEMRYTPPVPPESFPGPTTYVRCLHAAAVARTCDLPVLVSGGRFGWRAAEKPPASAVMKEKLVEMGIAAGRIWTEDASTTTSENADECARILKEKGVASIVLVTEAFHIRRATATFRKLGFRVIPAPCAFRNTQFRPREWAQYLPSAQAAQWNEDHLREWGAYFLYWLRGRV